MSLPAALLVAAALWGIGVYGAISQRSIVMLMMGLELMIGAGLLAAVALWRYAGAGLPEGQLLVIVGMALMAIEMAIGFAVVVNVYRVRATDVTEGLGDLEG